MKYVYLTVASLDMAMDIWNAETKAGFDVTFWFSHKTERWTVSVGGAK